ncbi:MAG: phosphoribosylformylglycinamidine synthase subunit PurQ, partial [Thiohalobacterales bacterium]|nr:phosphoribosylformylglycinamidine synthase subunit PurQ [Thiohalobacterales bacterium]
SMKTVWQEGGEDRAVTAPLSLIVSAFAPVVDVRRTLTPQLRTDAGDSVLLLIDLGQGRNRLGGSALAQVYKDIGSTPPDVDHPALLKAFFSAVQELNRDNLLLAYHDRSDGGLLACLAEMAFAGHTGLTVHIDGLGEDPVAALFAEELGAVLQVKDTGLDTALAVLRDHGLKDMTHAIGHLNDSDRIEITLRENSLLSASRIELQRAWSATTCQLQSLRDNSDCAQQEYDAILDADDPGIRPIVTFDAGEDIAAPLISTGAAPRIAILREQGVNGQVEMAAAFHRAGFEAIDVHMSDLLAGRQSLDRFTGLVACGGFSFGDVLGAGQGWAKSVLFHSELRDMFAAFFAREDSFSLGVCNGCQMLSGLKSLIPGAGSWPRFVRNLSEQFEARVSQLEILDTSSIFFAGMTGAILPIAVAHGEGRADFGDEDPAGLMAAGLVAARYVDGHGRVAERYPANPNGSPLGITALTSTDGRATIMMPHPERVFRSVTNSWCPDDWG